MYAIVVLIFSLRAPPASTYSWMESQKQLEILLSFTLLSSFSCRRGAKGFLALAFSRYHLDDAMASIVESKWRKGKLKINKKAKRYPSSGRRKILFKYPLVNPFPVLWLCRKTVFSIFSRHRLFVKDLKAFCATRSLDEADSQPIHTFLMEIYSACTLFLFLFLLSPAPPNFHLGKPSVERKVFSTLTYTLEAFSRFSTPTRPNRSSFFRSFNVCFTVDALRV